MRSTETCRWRAGTSRPATAACAYTSAWGRRSLIESLMLPDVTEDVVAHSLEPYMDFGFGFGHMGSGVGGGGGSGFPGSGSGYSDADGDGFHDAYSRFGSLASSLVSGVTSTGSNIMGYVASAAGGVAGGWMAAAAVPDLAAGGSMVLELTDLYGDLDLDPAYGAGTSGGGAGSNTLAVQAGQIHVYEQLPAACGSRYGISPLEWGRVTCVEVAAGVVELLLPHV
eukprot:XP_001696680.1 predicted protein [Chlamydomonas reinhardtii]